MSTQSSYCIAVEKIVPDEWFVHNYFITADSAHEARLMALRHCIRDEIDIDPSCFEEDDEKFGFMWDNPDNPEGDFIQIPEIHCVELGTAGVGHNPYTTNILLALGKISLQTDGAVTSWETIPEFQPEDINQVAFKDVEQFDEEEYR